jgi:hypothetical protein
LAWRTLTVAADGLHAIGTFVARRRLAAPDVPLRAGRADAAAAVEALATPAYRRAAVAAVPVLTWRTSDGDGKRGLALLRETVPVESGRTGENQERRRSAAALPNRDIAHVTRLFACDRLGHAIVIAGEQARKRRFVERTQETNRYALHAMNRKRA